MSGVGSCESRWICTSPTARTAGAESHFQAHIREALGPAVERCAEEIPWLSSHNLELLL
jgi:hypothetical protein